MENWIDVGAVCDLEDGEILAASADGLPVALCRHDGAVFALHDRCSHGAARLSDGYLDNGCIECPLHQGLVDVATGEPRSDPITLAVRTYPVRLKGDRIEVLIA